MIKLVVSDLDGTLLPHDKQNIDEETIDIISKVLEKNIEEIAYIFHLTESNVKVKLHRIRKKLCNLMKEEI